MEVTGYIQKGAGATVTFDDNSVVELLIDDKLEIISDMTAEQHDALKVFFNSRANVNSSVVRLDPRFSDPSLVDIGGTGTGSGGPSTGTGAPVPGTPGYAVIYDATGNALSEAPLPAPTSFGAATTASDDAIGAGGSSGVAAHTDHKHAAQAPSSDPNNATIAGSDGLHQTPVAQPADITSSTANKVISSASVIDEDNMASDSDQRIPTQQSVKAYVDSTISSVPTGIQVPLNLDVGGAATFTLPTGEATGKSWLIVNAHPDGTAIGTTNPITVHTNDKLVVTNGVTSSNDDGSDFIKYDNTDLVLSVNGEVGAVVIDPEVEIVEHFNSNYDISADYAGSQEIISIVNTGAAAYDVTGLAGADVTIEPNQKTDFTYFDGSWYAKENAPVPPSGITTADTTADANHTQDFAGFGQTWNDVGPLDINVTGGNVDINVTSSFIPGAEGDLNVGLGSVVASANNGNPNGVAGEMRIDGNEASLTGDTSSASGKVGFTIDNSGEPSSLGEAQIFLKSRGVKLGNANAGDVLTLLNAQGEAEFAAALDSYPSNRQEIIPAGGYSVTAADAGKILVHGNATSTNAITFVGSNLGDRAFFVYPTVDDARITVAFYDHKRMWAVDGTATLDIAGTGGTQVTLEAGRLWKIAGSNGEVDIIPLHVYDTGSATSFVLNDDAVPTIDGDEDYTNAISVGNRSTIAGGNSFLPGGAGAMVDGDRSSFGSNSYFVANTNGFFTYNLPAPVRLKEFRMYSKLSEARTNASAAFRILGSTDGTNFVDITGTIPVTQTGDATTPPLETITPCLDTETAFTHLRWQTPVADTAQGFRPSELEIGVVGATGSSIENDIGVGGCLRGDWKLNGKPLGASSANRTFFAGTVDLDALLTNFPENVAYHFQVDQAGASLTTAVAGGFGAIINGDATGGNLSPYAIPGGVQGYVSHVGGSIAIAYTTNTVTSSTIDLDASVAVANYDLGTYTQDKVVYLNVVDPTNGGVITSSDPIVGDLDISQCQAGDQLTAIAQVVVPVLTIVGDETAAWVIAAGDLELVRAGGGVGFTNAFGALEWSTDGTNFGTWGDEIGGGGTPVNVDPIYVRNQTTQTTAILDILTWAGGGGAAPFTGNAFIDDAPTNGWRVTKESNASAVPPNIMSADLQSDGPRTHTFATGSFDEHRFIKQNSVGSDTYEFIYGDDQFDVTAYGYAIDGTTQVEQTGLQVSSDGILQAYEGNSKHSINGDVGMPRQRRASDGWFGNSNVPYYDNPSIVKVDGGEIDFTAAEPALNNNANANMYFWNTTAGAGSSSGTTYQVGLYAFILEPTGLLLDPYMLELQTGVCAVRIGNTTYQVDNDDTLVPLGVGVIDSLTSTDTASALSANQGRLLNEKINSLGTAEHDVANNADRNLLTDLTLGDKIFVADGTADSTVDSGWVLYRYLGTGTSGAYVDADFRKIQEEESLDITFLDTFPSNGQDIIPAGGYSATVADAGKILVHGNATPANAITFVGSTLGDRTFFVYPTVDDARITVAFYNNKQMWNVDGTEAFDIAGTGGTQVALERGRLWKISGSNGEVDIIPLHQVESATTNWAISLLDETADPQISVPNATPYDYTITFDVPGFYVADLSADDVTGSTTPSGFISIGTTVGGVDILPVQVVADRISPTALSKSHIFEITQAHIDAGAVHVRLGAGGGSTVVNPIARIRSVAALNQSVEPSTFLTQAISTWDDTNNNTTVETLEEDRQGIPITRITYDGTGSFPQRRTTDLSDIAVAEDKIYKAKWVIDPADTGTITFRTAWPSNVSDINLDIDTGTATASRAGSAPLPVILSQSVDDDVATVEWRVPANANFTSFLIGIDGATTDKFDLLSVEVRRIVPLETADIHLQIDEFTHQGSLGIVKGIDAHGPFVTLDGPAGDWSYLETDIDAPVEAGNQWKLIWDIDPSAVHTSAMRYVVNGGVADVILEPSLGTAVTGNAARVEVVSNVRVGNQVTTIIKLLNGFTATLRQIYADYGLTGSLSSNNGATGTLTVREIDLNYVPLELQDTDRFLITQQTGVNPSTLQVFNWTANALQINDPFFKLTDTADSATALESVQFENGKTKTLYLMGVGYQRDVQNNFILGVQIEVTNTNGVLTYATIGVGQFLPTTTPVADFPAHTWNDMTNTGSAITISQEQFNFIFGLTEPETPCVDVFTVTAFADNVGGQGSGNSLFDIENQLQAQIYDFGFAYDNTTGRISGTTPNHSVELVADFKTAGTGNTIDRLYHFRDVLNGDPVGTVSGTSGVFGQGTIQTPAKVTIPANTAFDFDIRSVASNNNQRLQAGSILTARVCSDVEGLIEAWLLTESSISDSPLTASALHYMQIKDTIGPNATSSVNGAFQTEFDALHAQSTNNPWTFANNTVLLPPGRYKASAYMALAATGGSVGLTAYDFTNGVKLGPFTAQIGGSNSHGSIEAIFDVTSPIEVGIGSDQSENQASSATFQSSLLIEQLPTKEFVTPDDVPVIDLAHGRMELNNNQGIAADIEDITMATSTGGVGVYPFNEVTIMDGGMVATVAGFVDNNAASQNPTATNATSSMVVPNDGKYEAKIAVPSALDSTVETDDRPLAAIFVNGVIHKVFNIHDLAFDASSADQDKFVTDVLVLSAGDRVHAGYRIEGGGTEAWGYREPLETNAAIDVVYSFFELRQLAMKTVFTVPTNIENMLILPGGAQDLDTILAEAPINFGYPFHATAAATLNAGNGMELVIDGEGVAFGSGSQSQPVPAGTRGHIYKLASGAVGVSYTSPTITETALMATSGEVTITATNWGAPTSMDFTVPEDGEYSIYLYPRVVHLSAETDNVTQWRVHNKTDNVTITRANPQVGFWNAVLHRDNVDANESQGLMGIAHKVPLVAGKNYAAQISSNKADIIYGIGTGGTLDWVHLVKTS